MRTVAPTEIGKVESKSQKINKLQTNKGSALTLFVIHHIDLQHWYEKSWQGLFVSLNCTVYKI